MKELLIAIVVLILLTATISAAIPQQISYQGRLTSSAGTPITGTKSLTFKIYDGGDAMLWDSGPVSVTCTDGLFSVILGGAGQPALLPGVLTDPEATLGITVESDPELSPRTKLTSAPFSYTALIAPDYLPLAGGTLTGSVTWNFPDKDAFVQNAAGTSSIGLMGTSGPAAQLSSDGNGSLTLRNSNTSLNAQLVSGVWGGQLLLYTPTGALTHRFRGDTGDESALLPNNAISSPEMLDEPGVARGVNYDFDSLKHMTWTDVVSVTITTPAPGYIYLTGQCYVEFVTSSAVYQLAEFQIDEPTAPGDNFGVRVGGQFTAAGTYDWPVTLSRVYYKPAGTYTFRMKGERIYNNDTQAWPAWPILNAIYLPTSYGTVASVISSPESGQFESAKAASASDGRTLYEVDLRELELKAAKARAASQKAELELLEAQMHEQPLQTVK